MPPPKKLDKPKAAVKKPANAVPKKKVKGYQMPEHVPIGTILTDMQKQQYRIGASIGTGGFGEIYSACRMSGTTTSKNADNYPYAVKVVSFFGFTLQVMM